MLTGRRVRVCVWLRAATATTVEVVAVVLLMVVMLLLLSLLLRTCFCAGTVARYF